LVSTSASDDDARVPLKPRATENVVDILKIACEEVRQEPANYMEEDALAEVRQRIENPFLTWTAATRFTTACSSHRQQRCHRAAVWLQPPPLPVHRRSAPGV